MSQEWRRTYAYGKWRAKVIRRDEVCQKLRIFTKDQNGVRSDEVMLGGKVLSLYALFALTRILEYVSPRSLERRSSRNAAPPSLILMA